MMKLWLALLVLVLCLVGCSSSQIVSNLQAVLTTAEIAFPIVAQQTNLSPVVVAQVDGYFHSVGSAVAQTAPILASAVSPAQKASQISLVFASVIKPQLPKGTPQAVVDAVTSIAGAVTQFLASVQIPGPKSLSPTSKLLIPSGSDLDKLSKIEIRAKIDLEKFKR